LIVVTGCVIAWMSRVNASLPAALAGRPADRAIEPAPSSFATVPRTGEGSLASSKTGRPPSGSATVQARSRQVRVIVPEVNGAGSAICVSPPGKARTWLHSRASASGP